jgi:hypothetical protein
MHEYSVEFRIFGDELDPEEVTIDLGLEPSNTWKAKDAPSQESMWGYDGFAEDPNMKIWTSLEEGLSFLLDKLFPYKEKIDEYKRTYDAIWWCGHFQSSFSGGPTLSPKLLKALGEFGVDLQINNHFVRDDEASSESSNEVQSQ